jgi:hypothetical protein
MTANNVIKGPWVGNDPTHINVGLDLDDTPGIQHVNKAIHIQETLINLMPALFNAIERYGFQFDELQEEATKRDGTFVIEAVKSLLCKYYDLHHPFQDIAEQAFIVDDGGELDFAEKLALDLKPMEPFDLTFLEDNDEDDDRDLLEE